MKLEDQLARWKEQFEDVLILQPSLTLNINVADITEMEVATAIRHLKNGKAGGIDNIPPEAPKFMDISVS